MSEAIEEMKIIVPAHIFLFLYGYSNNILFLYCFSSVSLVFFFKLNKYLMSTKPNMLSSLVVINFSSH